MTVPNIIPRWACHYHERPTVGCKGCIQTTLASPSFKAPRDEEQAVRKADILSLIEAYNEALQPGEDRLCLEAHGYMCRCQTCWGAGTDKMWATLKG